MYDNLKVYNIIDMDQPIITQDYPSPFIVRVKLLTNQVFDFQVTKDMKVADFKNIVSPKVNVPVDRMRIVFGGKQLLDDKPLSDYVSESGLTVHLIARSAPQPQQPQSQPAQQPPQNNQQPPNINNPFGDIMGMVNSMFGAPTQQSTATNGPITMSFSSNLNGNALNGLLGNLGIRLPPMNQPPQPVPQPVQSQPSQQSSSQSNSNNNRNQSRISYSQIGQLNQNLNNLQVPLDNVTTEQETLTAEGVIRYLRRLHHQSTRSMQQLNRLLNTTQNNNTTHLEGFIPVLQSLNSANTVAINCLTQLQTQRTQSQTQPIQPTQPLQSTQPTQSTQSTQPTQNILQGLPFLGGFNLPNMMNMGMTMAQPQPQSQSQQAQSSQSQQSRPQGQPQNGQQFNPMGLLGGLNLGNLFGSLQSVGGINGLFGLSLREMMSQNGQQQVNGILLDLFGGMTGQNIMQAFTTKNFTFLKEKHGQIQTNLKKHIDEQGEQQTINRLVEEISNVLVPSKPHPMINNLNQCQLKCKKNLRNHVRKLVALTLQNNEQYDIKSVAIGKQAFCENIDIVSEYTANNNTNVAFQIIKVQAVATMEPLLPGIAGMFYGLVQRDLFRIYNQHKAQQERRKQMTKQDTESQQKLIDIIKQVGARDSQKLSNVQHSKQESIAIVEMSRQNPQPKLYQAFQLTTAQKQQRILTELNNQVEDPYDEIQIFQLIRHINDPEYPLTLQQLNVVNLQRIYLRNQNLVQVYFTPTIPHCSMAQMIGLMLRVKLLRFLPKRIKSRVMITPGTHVSQLQINKQINDKERVAAAIENPKIGTIIMRGYFNSDRFQF